jgi:hypothetical protein
MLTRYDWLRRCQSGQELLATINYFKTNTHSLDKKPEIGPPFSALTGPCSRCRIYARKAPRTWYCSVCEEILKRARHLSTFAKKCVVVWGYVNRMPKKLADTQHASPDYLFIHDDHHFIQALRSGNLKDWLQELLLYNAADLRGLWQVFPTVGSRSAVQMGEALCWAAHHEPALSRARWYIRYFVNAMSIRRAGKLDRSGLLTYQVPEFLNLLEMALVFRTLLLPHEQRQLYELLTLDEFKEEQFFWGRFLGEIDQDVKDMLSEWRIRQWPKEQVKFLYELIKYVSPS